MTFEDAEYIEDSVEDILDAMLADAKEYFDEDLNDSEQSVIRTFYRPVAVQLSQIQGDIGIVLESAQIDNAQGTALDLLTALIGVQRIEASKAKGTVTFSRETASSSVDYTIPSGTRVQTEGLDPIRFNTSESATLLSGETSVDVPIESIEGGSVYNVTSNTLTVMTDAPTGIESVTNVSAISGGANVEPDEELRERAKKELSQGSRATQNAVLKSVGNLPGVEAVSIFPNGDEHNLGNRPGFELVVQGGNPDTIVQTINQTKAAGDYSYRGNFGTAVVIDAELINGQLFSEGFSRPTEIPIFIEASVSTTEEYEGDDVVTDSVINYIGGITTSGTNISGKISVGDDVLIGEIEYAIREIDGVYDVTNLFIGKSSSPNGESNIVIDDFEVATSDGLDGSIIISSS